MFSAPDYAVDRNKSPVSFSRHGVCNELVFILPAKLKYIELLTGYCSKITPYSTDKCKEVQLLFTLTLEMAELKNFSLSL